MCCTQAHNHELLAQVRSRAQHVLLERIVSEPVHSVRRALTDVAASIAHLTVPQQQWPGLLEFLHQCSRADSVEHREVGLLLFAALFETIGEGLVHQRCWLWRLSALNGQAVTV